MAYPTLEELKKFEIGSGGKFFVRFGDTDFNIIKSGRGIIPATNVAYKHIGTEYYDIPINKTTVPLLFDVKYPTTISLECFDDHKETLFKNLLLWIKSTTVFKTGRLPKDLLQDTKKLEVYEYDKDEKGGLRIINKDVFNINPPMELNKAFSMGVAPKTFSLEFNIVGGVVFNPK